MKQKIMIVPLLVLTTLLTSAPVFAAWTPEYKVRILFVKDLSVNIANLPQYSQSAISHLNKVFKKSIVKLKAEYAGSESHNGRFDNIDKATTNQQVTAWKEKHKADFIFFWSNSGIPSGVCGVGKKVDTNNGAFAMGAIKNGCYSLQTFAHEVGHNFGLSHVKQVIANKQSEGKLQDKPLYAAGWGRFGSYAFVTTMGYPHVHGGPRLDIYSIPSIHSCFSKPCGDRDGGDAAKYINDNLARRFKHGRIKYPYLTLFGDAYKNETSYRVLKESTVDLNDTGYALIPENFFIPEGWKVRFYHEPNFKGAYYQPLENTLEPNSHAQQQFRQTAYSVEILQGGVSGFFIYDHKNWRGKSREIIGNVEDLKDFNSIMSSYKLPAGWIVRFYAEKNYQGDYWTVDTYNYYRNEAIQKNPTSYLDKIQSIEVFRQPPQ